jgi:hypothetical protein
MAVTGNDSQSARLGRIGGSGDLSNRQCWVPIACSWLTEAECPAHVRLRAEPKSREAEPVLSEVGSGKGGDVGLDPLPGKVAECRLATAS